MLIQAFLKICLSKFLKVKCKRGQVDLNKEQGQ